MKNPWIDIAGGDESRILIVGDHASSHVPPGVDLGIDPALLETHIAIDLGVEPLARALAARLDCHAWLGGVSRLVVDFNREADAPGLIPLESDGHAIPGNRIDEAARAARIADYWKPYHDGLARAISRIRPVLIVSLHSFTPKLEAQPHVERPWQVGVLYNNDSRAARIAIPVLEAANVTVGDQLPYSGKILNATMNRHGEGNAIPYLGLEVRQDVIATPEGVERWSGLLALVIARCVERLAIDVPLSP